MLKTERTGVVLPTKEQELGCSCVAHLYIFIAVQQTH